MEYRVKKYGKGSWSNGESKEIKMAKVTNGQ